MPKRVLTVLIWGLAGLAVALGLTAGAFALVGGDIAEPGDPLVFTPSPGPRASPSVGRDDPASRSPELSATPSPSQAGDDDNSGSGSGDESGSEDNPGSGSGGSDDNSGPGSDNSGSGSNSSGSGSDNSGSDSDHDDD